MEIIGKKFALLQCAEDPEHVKERYGGYLQVYTAMLAEEGEEWALFRAYRGELPAEDEIGTFDGFVITASSANAHDNDTWICNLLSLVKRLQSMKKKVLGLRFGHQILGRAIGGKTGRSATGWDIGVTAVHLSPSSSSELFHSLKMPPSLNVLEFHQDEKKELPAEAEIMGWSEKTGIEMLKYGEDMMGIQGHPDRVHQGYSSRPHPSSCQTRPYSGRDGGGGDGEGAGEGRLAEQGWLEQVMHFFSQGHASMIYIYGDQMMI